MSLQFKRTPKPKKVIILGPVSAGKTTLIYRLANQPVPVSMVPTACDVLEKNTEENGRRIIYSEQKHYTNDADIVVYVLSANELSAHINKLTEFVAIEERKQVPLLVLVNKSDLKQSEEQLEHEVADILVPLLKPAHSFNVISCSLTTDTTIDKLRKWLEPKLID